MTLAADNAFTLAYKSWLETDANFWCDIGGNPSALNKEKLREIGRVFLVNRTIPKNDEARIIGVITSSGQADDIPIERRAAQISRVLEASGSNAASAVSKISWFIWPSGWTMYDRLAARAVIGNPQANALTKFERFYATLALRGWDDILAKVRQSLSNHGFRPLLAERTVDKFLMLSGMDDKDRAQTAVRLAVFRAEFPDDMSARLINTGNEIAQILQPGTLLNSVNRTDRKELKMRLERFQQLKSEIA